MNWSIILIQLCLAVGHTNMIGKWSGILWTTTYVYMNRGKYICTKLAVNVVMVSKVVCLFQPSQSHCVKL